LADLISSNVVAVVRLTEIFRQAAESEIVTAAYAINQGRMPELKPPEGLTDFYFIESQEPEAIQDLIVRLVKERIPARFGFDPKADIQVLTPMNRSVLGARNLNQVLQTALNPGDGGPEIERFGWTFRLGDRVIQTENDYNRDVFNGDLGMVEKINRIEQQMVVNFEGREVEYDFGDLDELALAYVLSIHKSQGSEFPCVVIPVHTQHYMMLQRNLLYTAVTRGKKLVIQGDGTIMIDAGSPNQARRFRKAMERLRIDPRSISLIVITHGHFDHIGSARDIQKITGAKIAMHYREKDWLEKALKPLPPAVTTWGAIFKATMGVFLPLITFPPAKVDVVLGDDGLSLADYGIPGKIIHTPGHSLGSVSVLLETGDAFVGDLAMNGLPLRLSPGLPIFAEDLQKVKESWKLLLDQGAKTVYPAHWKPFPADIMRRDVLGSD
jgi:glyoxylase-like metal-dependent hydrolase (beta-lactamase superfamily II)